MFSYAAASLAALFALYSLEARFTISGDYGIGFRCRALARDI